MSDIICTIDQIISEIRNKVGNKRVIIAFSGGMDSTVVLHLAKYALKREQVIAVNIDFGNYTYRKARENVKKIAGDLQIRLFTISGQDQQLKIMAGGPDCNLCTKRIKLGLIKNSFKNHLILTGSNQSDSWGKYGYAYYDGYFAPLFYCTKNEIKNIADYLNIKIHRIGENKKREGCKLKHLLKPLVNFNYHGVAVDIANEILLEKLSKSGIDADKANVKIVGTLNENIALVNIYPLPDSKWLEEIRIQIANIKEIEECHIVDSPLELIIKANKGQFNNLRSRFWIENGRLKPDFAFPVKIKWLLTSNRKLKTFQVVDYNIID